MNRFRSYVWMVCLLCASVLAVSCSREVVSTPDSGLDASGSGVEAGNLRIVIRTPSPDAVMNPGSRSEEIIPPVTVEDEQQEWTVKTLGVYIFMAQEENDTDAEYHLVQKTEGITFGKMGIPGKSGTNRGNGVYSYTEPLQNWMLKKYLKVVLVANEGKELGVADGEGSNGTTLKDFKQFTSSAILSSSENQRADIISGGAYTGEGDLTDGGAYRGIVMSGLALQKTDQADKIYLESPSPLELEATLTRIVARIDICLNKKNLKLKEAFLKKTACKAFLFADDDGSISVPDGSILTAYPLLPVSAYADVLGADKDGVSYLSPAEDEEAAVTRENNTLKHVFYLYEQNNSSTNCTTVVVKFTLKDDLGNEHEGELEIPFKIKDAEGKIKYVPVTRNHLYTVELGDGSLDGKTIISRLVVADWEPNEVEDILNPDEDVVQ